MITEKDSLKTATGSTIRLVHDNEILLLAFRGDADTQTATIHQLEEFDTPQVAYQRVIALGLEFDEQVFVDEYGQDDVDSWKA